MNSGTTNTLNGITSFCNRYIAVGDGGTIMTKPPDASVTPDKQTWIIRTSGTSSKLYGVTYGNYTLVVVGEKGTILQSDPLTNVDTPVGTNVLVSPPGGGINVIFTGVTSRGTTSMTTSSNGPPPPANFQLGNPPTYYDVSTTATYTLPVKVCITYDPAQYSDPSKPVKLLHYEDGTWVDVTTSNDTTNHIIRG